MEVVDLILDEFVDFFDDGVEDFFDLVGCYYEEVWVEVGFFVVGKVGKFKGGCWLGFYEGEGRGGKGVCMVYWFFDVCFCWNFFW